MAVHVVTDSTVRFSSNLVHELPITIVPFHIQIEDRQYLDGIDLDNKEFLRLTEQQKGQFRVIPPSVEEFYRVYKELQKPSSDILSVHLPDKLGKTVQNARQAASMLLGQCKIEPLDAQTTSLGLGILVEAAARAATQGHSIDDIIRYVRGIIPQIYIVFFSENLSDLERVDGIGPAQAMLGTILGIKPLFTLEEGEIIPIEKVRSRESAIEKLIEFVTEFDALKQIAIIKSSDEPDEETKYITEKLHEVFPNIEALVMSYGPVLRSVVGPAALGVVVYEDVAFEG